MIVNVTSDQVQNLYAAPAGAESLSRDFISQSGESVRVRHHNECKFTGLCRSVHVTHVTCLRFHHASEICLLFWFASAVFVMINYVDYEYQLATCDANILLYCSM